MKIQKRNPSREIVSLIDSGNKVIGSVSRGEMRKKGLGHRVTYLLVFSKTGQLLVQTRTGQKDWYPGYLDFAAGGVVLAGETYEQSAGRELEEELGITADLTPHFYFYFEDNSTAYKGKSWGRVFSCVNDGPFTLQEEEVEAVEFVEMETALGIDQSMVTPDTRLVLMAYLL